MSYIYDDDDYDDDDYGYSDDDWPEDIADVVDSLAEHTAHSPILVNAAPDLTYEYDEWEYMTDEYYDGDGDEEAERESQQIAGAKGENAKLKLGKRKRLPNESGRDAEEAQHIPGRSKAKKLKLPPKSQTNGEEEMRPFIKWRQDDDNSSERVPRVRPGDGTPVALVVDWRALVDQQEEVDGGGEEEEEEAGQKMVEIGDDSKIALKVEDLEKTTTLRKGKRPRESEVLVVENGTKKSRKT